LSANLIIRNLPPDPLVNLTKGRSRMPLEHLCQLSYGKRFMLNQNTQRNPFPLAQWKSPVGFGKEVDHFRLDNTPGNGYFDTVTPFSDFRQWLPLRSEHLIQ